MRINGTQNVFDLIAKRRLVQETSRGNKTILEMQHTNRVVLEKETRKRIWMGLRRRPDTKNLLAGEDIFCGFAQV